MTTCGKFPTGDRGQRYEHHAIDVDTGKDVVLGWSETKDDTAFSQMVELSPSKKDYRCVDRQKVKVKGKKE